MRTFAKLASDRTAAVAVEFAFILPVLVTLLFGTVEAANLTLAYMKVVGAAETVADLVSQQTTGTTWSATDIDNFVQAGKLVLTPLPTNSFGVAIASVTFAAANGTPTLAWQRTRNASPMTNPTALAAGYGTAETNGTFDSVIIVLATYTYTSPIRYLLAGSFTLSQTAYLRPRNVAAVTAS